MKNFTAQELQIIDRFNTYKAWAKEELIDTYGLKSFAFNYPEYLEDKLCGCSNRYAGLVKIEAIIAKTNFVAKLRAYGDRLQTKWYRLADKYTGSIDKASCHWKKEGFESREDYLQYLQEHSTDNNYGYAMNVVENLIYDLYDKVLLESYDLNY